MQVESRNDGMNFSNYMYLQLLTGYVLCKVEGTEATKLRPLMTSSSMVLTSGLGSNLTSP